MNISKKKRNPDADSISSYRLMRPIRLGASAETLCVSDVYM